MKKHNKTNETMLKTFNLINSFKDDNGNVYKTNDELREPLGMSRRTIVRYINYLEDEGKVIRKGRKYRKLIVIE